MSASLGGTIKGYRIQKHKSQFEVALGLGWSESSRLSRIEQGKIKPSSQVVDKISSVLGLDMSERAHLLYVGNFVPDDQEVHSLVDKTKAYLESWKYPTALYDFTWRFLETNKAGERIFFQKDSDVDKIRREKPNVLEMLFSDRFSQNILLPKSLKKISEEEKLQTLIQYRTEQRARTKEGFYRAFLKRMAGNKEFIRLWRVSEDSVSLKLTLNYTFDETTITARGKRRALKFHIVNLPIRFDDRFYLEIHFPADISTFQYFHGN